MSKDIPQNAYLSPAGTLVLAHRGLAGPGAPENTIRAFLNALDAGATHLETDVQVTKDGVAVLFHDDDLRRVAGINKKVSELTLLELREVYIDGQVIPTLNEALAQLPTAKFNLDIKTEGAVSPTVGAIVLAKAHDRVLVSSFSHERRMKALEMLTGAGLSVASSADGSTILALAWAAFRGDFEAFARKSQGLCALQIPASYFGISLTFKRLLAFAARAEIEVHYWVINDARQMLELVRLGARGIVTDRADLAVATVR